MSFDIAVSEGSECHDTDLPSGDTARGDREGLAAVSRRQVYKMLSLGASVRGSVPLPPVSCHCLLSEHQRPTSETPTGTSERQRHMWG